MNRPTIGILAVGALTCWLFLTAEPAPAQTEAANGRVVEFAGLKGPVPKDWAEDTVREKSCTRRFQLDGVGSIKYNAHVTLFRFDRDQLPTADDAVKMWQRRFAPPPGKTIQEPTSVKKFAVAGLTFTQVDIIGTYQGFADDPGTGYCDFRLIGVFAQTRDGVCLAQLIGPTETVEFYRKGFEAWLENLH